MNRLMNSARVLRRRLPANSRPHISIFRLAECAGLLLVGSGIPLHAESIFKSIDQEGNVTYSTTPPQDAVESAKITPPAAPTAEQVREAEERARKTEEFAGTLTKEREAREQERAQRAAEDQARQAAAVPAPVYGPVPAVPYPYSDYPYLPLQPARPSRPPGERPSRPRPR